LTKKQAPAPPSHLTAPEPHPFIAKRKAALAKKFSVKRMDGLFDYVDIAWLVLAAGREEEARAMADWLGETVVFDGNFNVWTPVSRAIALSARLRRLANQSPSPWVDKLVAHQALAEMDREGLEAWVARKTGRLAAALAEKPSQRATLDLASGCATTAFYRETCVPGIYYAEWLDKAALDDLSERGLAATRGWLDQER
jgi:hypothetical protein